MWQKFYPILTWLLIMFLFFLPTCQASTETIQLDSISAQAYVLMDADSGKVLKSKNAHQHLAPASMTKLMTMLLTLEAIAQGKAHPTDLIIASEKAASMDGTRIYLEPGEAMSLDDMIKSMALASANDASVAIAEKLAGSESKFVQQMNAKAKAIGMKDSCFMNASGMPAQDHYSSAYDMAILARYTLANTSVLDYSSLKQYSLRQGNFPIYNSNKLLWQYQGADGLKNGYTSQAHNCLTATAKRDKLRLIAVVMGCPLRGGQTADATTLLDYGFEHFASRRLMPAGKVLATVKIKAGDAQEVSAVVADEVNALYDKDKVIAFTCRQDLPDIIEAPIKKGQKIGEMQILYDGELLKKVDLLAAANIKRLSLLERIWRIPWGFKLLVSIFVILYSIRSYNLRRNRRRRSSRSRITSYNYTGSPIENYPVSKKR